MDMIYYEKEYLNIKKKFNVSTIIKISPFKMKVESYLFMILIYY